MPFAEHFEIDIVSALSQQLLTAFGELETGSLDVATLATLEKNQGVYQLYQGALLVYVGKADNIPRRLGEHRTKIAGRRNITTDGMGFKCLYVHKNWTTLAPEDALIKYYKAQSNDQCAWNGNGFGPHDPGRNREITNKDPDGFDARYPIKDDWVCEWVDARDWNCRELLVSLKDRLPYLLRYETNDQAHYRRGHPDYNAVTITVPRTGMTAAELLGLIARNLPGWQATAFPSHMILYRETRQYTHGHVL